MTKKAFIPLAHGVEEMEAIILIDVLRRAGVNVTTCSLGPSDEKITASRKTILLADCSIEECSSQSFDLIALPGGMPGATNLSESNILKQMIVDHFKQGHILAAICAAPAVVLAPLNLLEGKSSTCYPSFKEQIPQYEPALKRGVVISEQLITGTGPGAAFNLALTCVEKLLGQDIANKIAQSLVFPQAQYGQEL